MFIPLSYKLRYLALIFSKINEWVKLLPKLLAFLTPLSCLSRIDTLIFFFTKLKWYGPTYHSPYPSWTSKEFIALYEPSLFISSIEASANPLQNPRKEFYHEGTSTHFHHQLLILFPRLPSPQHQRRDERYVRWWPLDRLFQWPPPEETCFPLLVAYIG